MKYEAVQRRPVRTKNYFKLPQDVQRWTLLQCKGVSLEEKKIAERKITGWNDQDEGEDRSRAYI